MIIVPTEKQLDWRHAPVVLCALVLLNFMVFFFYQSNDKQKLTEVMQDYQTYGYLEYEWPLFEQYLSSKQETALIDTFREQYQDENYTEISANLLMRNDFYIYLQEHAESSFRVDLYEEWLFERPRLHKLMQSVSFIAGGLRANDLQVINFLSHQFLHSDIMHLLGNMFFLIICGFAVEAAIGHWRFLAFYLISGFAAGFAQLASDWNSFTPLIGASGSISGVMAMYLAIFRFKKIEFFYWFLFIVGYFRVPALLILPFYIGKEIYSFYSATESNVAFMAHAGGFVAGALLIGFALLINRSILNRDYIESDQSIDLYQAKLSKIYSAIERYQFDRALTAADALINEKGLCFELAIIRYNLLKISQNEDFSAAMTNLFTLPFLTPVQIIKIEKIWNEHPDVHEQLNEQSAIKLGIQFSTLSNPTSSEKLFELLLNRTSDPSSLSVFASKLSAAFLREREQNKKSHYENLSKKLAQGE